MTYSIETFSLANGSHERRADGMCAMEAVAWLAGEQHSDAPACASPVITSFIIVWNDALPSDAERDRLLKPLLRDIIGTRTNEADELRRSWLAFDWLVRVHAPAWMDPTPALKPHADALRGLPELTDRAALGLATPILAEARSASAAAGDAAWDATRVAAWDATRVAAWDAAGDAAGDAAWDAARDAAGDAAWDAAWDATRVAAWDAAWDATRVAAGDAAGDAAWVAAWDAAWAAAGDATRVAAWAAAGDAAWDATRVAAWVAAWDKLSPTTAELQASAQNLVRRMCAVGRVS